MAGWDLIRGRLVGHPLLQLLEPVEDDMQLSSPEPLKPTALIVPHPGDKRAVGEDVPGPHRRPIVELPRFSGHPIS